MATNAKPHMWNGEYAFHLSGSGLHEDTLRVRSSYHKQEQTLKLVLPTLCITYADAKFQDSVGGEQENYPASSVYGPAYFDPPIEILGEQDIKDFTYIRGARRVEIGPKRTVVEFPSWNDLVIPRMRLNQKEPVEAFLHIPDTRITVEEPLQITALQYADGRHVGGVRLEKRHPDWKPPEREKVYSLWIRVINGITLQPLPEAMVDILHWSPKVSTPYGAGGFRQDDRAYTDGNGCIHIPKRPSGELEAYIVRAQGSRSVVRCLRPLAGQNVRIHMRVWPMKRDTMKFTWPKGGKLQHMAGRSGASATDIQRLNRLKASSVLRPATRINLPYYVATYYAEPWDTLDWVGRTFGYFDAKGLAEANGLKDVADLDGGAGIRLPDWHFYCALENDTLDDFDAMFGLPKGSSITVGRAFHPDPRIPYPGETVAVPTPLFAEGLERKR